MSETNYFRLIEAYFDGSIDPLQKVMLENKIQTDPLLKAEFDLQSQIIEGIADVRKQQLKQRLSGIDVNGSGSALLGGGVKWLAAGLSVAVIFSAWLYWFSNSTESIEAIQLQNEDLHIWTETKQLPVPSVPEKNIAEVQKEPQIAKEFSPANSNQLQSIDKETTENVHSAKVKPQSLVVFQNEQLFSPTVDKDFSKTVDRDINRNMVSETKIEFLEPIEDSFQYHYKYYNNKLYLYGDFNNEPYEILELHNKGNKQLFLSYQDTIYRIDKDITEITPLAKVTDEMLILELNMILNE